MYKAPDFDHAYDKMVVDGWYCSSPSIGGSYVNVNANVPSWMDSHCTLLQETSSRPKYFWQLSTECAIIPNHHVAQKACHTMPQGATKCMHAVHDTWCFDLVDTRNMQCLSVLQNIHRRPQISTAWTSILSVTCQNEWHEYTLQTPLDWIITQSARGTPKVDLRILHLDPSSRNSPSTAMQCGDENNGIIILNDGVQHPTAIKIWWCQASCNTHLMRLKVYSWSRQEYHTWSNEDHKDAWCTADL